MMAACCLIRPSVFRRRLEDLGVFLFAEADRLVRRRPAHHRVVVEREAVACPSSIDGPDTAFMMVSVHSVQRGPSPPGPTAIFSIVPSPFCCGGIEVADEAAVDPQLTEVVLRRHVAAAVPVLVADAEIRDLVGRGVTVGGALLRERRRLRGRSRYSEPVGRFMRRARADVDGEIGLGCRSAPAKSMNSCVPNVFGLDHAAPVRDSASPDDRAAGRCPCASDIRRRSSRRASARSEL